MNLLILTQKIDLTDDVLGFFHDWVVSLAPYYKKIYVFCLYAGPNNLPKNVILLSLGKEKNSSFAPPIYNYLKYIFKFLFFIWKYRKNYDKIFVHMNQEYVILAGLLWKIWKKDIFMWRNHAQGNFLTKFAIYFCKNVFCTSPDSYTAKFSKTILMPVGINTNQFNFFTNSPLREKNFLLSLGRISPCKKIEIIIEALNLLDKRGVSFKITIIGKPLPKDFIYYEKLKKKSEILHQKKKLNWLGAVPFKEISTYYQKSSIFINTTPSGSLDKTIFEAIASGNLILISNRFFKNIIDNIFMFEESNPEDLANKLEHLIYLNENARENYQKKLSQYVIENHSLEALVKKLINIIK